MFRFFPWRTISQVRAALAAGAVVSVDGRDLQAWLMELEEEAAADR